MIRNDHILYSLLTVSVSLLSACGGSEFTVEPSIETISDLDFVNDLVTINSLGIVTDTSSETEPPIPVDGLNGIDGLEPNIPYTSSGISNSDTLSYSQYAGYDADIEATVLTLTIGTNSYPTIGFSLASDILSMNIVNVQRTVGAEFCSDNESINVTQTTDYATGVSLLTGRVRDQDISCETYFTPMMGSTITDADVGDFLTSYDLGEGISTTCPEDYLADVINVCSGNSITNFVVTDDANMTHNIAKQIIIDQ